MRVTLVNPPYIFWKPETQYLKPLLGQMPPLGLLSLAGATRAHMPDADITLLDAAAQDLSIEETAARVRRSAPDVLGITMTTMAARNAHAIAGAVRESLPDTCIVAGGPHVSGSGEKALKEAPAFDLGVVGEGEETFLAILDAVRRKRPVRDVPGLIYREGRDGPRRTPPR